MLRLQLADDITRYLMLKAKIEKCDSPPDAALETELREKVDSFLNSSIFPSNVSETNKGVSHTTINSNNIDTYHSPEKKKRKLSLVETSVRSQKVDVNVSIPLTHQIICRTKLATFLAKAAKYDALWNSLTRKLYQGSNMGN